MKKFIIIALALIAVAVGVYYYKNGTDASITDSIKSVVSGSDSNNEKVLAYVPADTVLFSGSVNAITYDKAMALSKSMGFDFADFLGGDKADLDIDDAPQAVQFLMGFYAAYMDGLAGDLTKTFGTTSTMNSALYLVGALPVARFELDGSETFAQLIAKIEADKNITPEVANIAGVEYRAYSFDNEGKEIPYQLVVAINDNQAIITANTPLADDKDLKLALGAEKPATSVLDSKVLNKLISKNGYTGHQLFYVNTLGIMQGVTDPKANSFGGMIQDLLAAHEQADALAEMQTPACKVEYTALAANWPTISGDYTSLTAKQASYKFKIEGTNADLIQNLSKLRGHLSPTLDNDDFLLSFGLGLNVDEFAPVLTNLWERMTKDAFECPPLVEMQAQLKQTNPMMLTMATGMVAGIKGMGLALVDVNVDALEKAQNNPMAATEGLNIFLTLSADKPQNLLQTLATFQPQFALELEDGAEPKVLPLPLPVEVKASLRGHDLVISFGDKANAIANDMSANSDLELNGVTQINMDMGRFFKLISKAVESKGDTMSEEEKAMFKMYSKIKGRIKYTEDWVEDGYAGNVEMIVK